MKRMIDQASFEKASSDIKEIQELLSGKAFFDGNIAVVQIGGDKGIKKENLPTKNGTYKLSSGILIVKENSASSITITALYGASMYAETRDPASTADFKFIEANRMGDKPIYCHPIHLSYTEAGTEPFRVTCLIFNNDPTPFTWRTFKNWLISMGTQYQLIKIMVSGAFSYNATCAIASYIVADSTYIQLVGAYPDGSNYSIVRNITGIEAVSIEDGVNRIN